MYVNMEEKICPDVSLIMNLSLSKKYSCCIILIHLHTLYKVLYLKYILFILNIIQIYYHIYWHIASDLLKYK